jgi:hypothetical protein
MAVELELAEHGVETGYWLEAVGTLLIFLAGIYFGVTLIRAKVLVPCRDRTHTALGVLAGFLASITTYIGGLRRPHQLGAAILYGWAGAAALAYWSFTLKWVKGYHELATNSLGIIVIIVFTLAFITMRRQDEPNKGSDP